MELIIELPNDERLENEQYERIDEQHERVANLRPSFPDGTAIPIAAVINGTSIKIPHDFNLSCDTGLVKSEKDLQCIKNHYDNEPISDQVEDYGGLMAYTERDAKLHPTVAIATRSVQEFGILLGLLGKPIKRVIMDACPFITQEVNRINSSFTMIGGMENIVDCIKSNVMGNKDDRLSELPEIREFYNTTIRPAIESQTEVSTTIGSPYFNTSTTSETPLGISGKSPDSSNSTINTIGGLAAVGVLVAGMAGMGFWKRKTNNEKSRKRYNDMVSNNELKLVQSSENNSLIPQNSIV